MTDDIDAILDYWFGELDEAGLPVTDRNGLWFKASDSVDRELQRQFGDLVNAALAGELPGWEALDRGLVAKLLLLDQFTRNIFRGTPQAFAGDQQALALAQTTIVSGHHQRLPAIHQAFLFLPLEHSEVLELQRESVTLSQQLAAITGSQLIASFARYAVAHHDVIAEFGRFPHRNEVLGRTSTPAELAHLRQHGGF